MQKEVAEEQERDKDMHEKLECYCTKNDGELSASTADLRDKIPQIEASITEAVSLKQQLDDELVQHKEDRKNAQDSIQSATKQREKEAASFSEESTGLKTNIDACARATDAISKGLGASFVQTPAATALRQLVVSRNLERYARETLTAFLSTTNGYAPQSGEIIGILRQLEEDMQGELKDITTAENDASTQFEGLISAKEKEIQAATEAIESKTGRAGETAVEIVSLKNDLEDTKESLGADERFLMELKKSCANGEKEHDDRVAARAEELVAISETIKILNDDDALDLFKKTLPSPSLLQEVADMRMRRDLRKHAIAMLQKARVKGDPDLSLITLALAGKKKGFEKVVKMIDDLVAKLATEQTDDDTHRKWCNKEFDSSEDDSKDLQRRIGGLETRIAESTEAIASLKDDLATLQQGIKDLDAAVAEATDQRQGGHRDFVQTAAENNAAVQLLGVARNRMNKFYNPALYKEPERRELTEEEQIFVNSGGADPRDAEEAASAGGGIAGTGVTVFTQMRARDAPPPPPETSEAYTKKDSSGPLALIDRLKGDLEKDVQANEMDEQQAQKDYEEMVSDSVAKRMADSKSITEKEAQKAGLEADLQAAKEGKKGASAELAAVGEYTAQLHGSCDFLVQNYDLRKEARANERDALKNAKAVLSGADFSFSQVKAFLHRK